MPPLLPAARQNDPIAHTSMLAMIGKVGAGLVTGVLVGVAATAAAGALLGAVGLTAVTGGLGAFVAVAVVSTLILHASQADKVVTAATEAAGDVLGNLFPPEICGFIDEGSPDVFINDLPAGRAVAEGGDNTTTCGKHPPSPPQYLAEGSTTVFINGFPAHRRDERTTCDAKTVEGSPNVFIGGDSIQTREIVDETSELGFLGVAAGVAVAVCTRNWKSIPGKLACLGLGMAIASATQAAVSTAFGHPIHAATGAKLLDGTDDTDFALPARLPLAWVRRYSSLDTADGLLGPGWRLPVTVALRLNQPGPHPHLYVDESGREIPFEALAPGESLTNIAEGYRLACTAGGHYVVEGDDGLYRDFGPARSDAPHSLPLVGLEDRNGNAVHLHYEADGRLATLTDGAGRLYRCRYDERHPGRLAAVELAGEGAEPEILVRYAYDARGRLAAVTDRLGHTVRRFTWHDAGPGAGLLASHTLPTGLTAHYEWGAFPDHPRVVRHWTDDGAEWWAEYDVAAGTTAVTDHQGGRQAWRWNPRFAITAHTDACGNTWTLEWNDDGQLAATTQPNGGRWRFAYDPRGNLSEETDPLGATVRTLWNTDRPLPARRTDPLGAVTTFEYDGHGNLIAETTPAGTTRYVLDRHGQPVLRVDAKGGRSHWTWNEAGQLVAHRDCSGRLTRFEHDPHGHPSARIDALGQRTEYRHDRGGRLLELHEADGSRRTWEWDPAGQPLAAIDAAGHPTRYRWNARGQLDRRTDAAGRVQDYRYDTAANLVQLVNENHEAYGFEYDTAGRLVAQVALDGLRTEYRLDPLGLPAEVRQAAGTPDEIRIVLERDLAGRLVAKRTPETLTRIERDPAGRSVRIVRHAIERGEVAEAVLDQIEFGYDPAGNLVAERTAALIEGRLVRHTLAHAYDALGNRTATTLPDGRTLNFLHYGAGHLHQINLDGVPVTDLERDALHREVLRTQGRLEAHSRYDALSRKTAHWSGIDRHDGLTPERRIGKAFRYDATGELVVRGDELLGELHHQYDPTGRILATTSVPGRARPGAPTLDERFAYDPAGNLLDAANAPEAFGAAHGLAPRGFVRHDRVLVFEDKRYAYDAHGRLHTKRIGSHTTHHFVYDSEHRLVEAHTRRRGVEQTTRYRYDALGRRIAKADRFGITHFVWDGLRLLHERRGRTSHTYLYQPDSHEPLARLDTTTEPGEPPGTAEVHYFHNHANGAPEELTDADGRIVWRARYATWGNLALESWHRDIDPARHRDRAHQPLRLQGQYADAETGLHYNTFRYYDPDIGRFTTPDPIGLAGGSNLYQFAPNPNGWIDPWGWSCTFSQKANRWRDTSTGRFNKRPASPAELVNNGKVQKSDIDAWATQGQIPNTWNPDPVKFPTGGFKYESNGYSAHGHGANPVAAAKWPHSNAAQGPTVRISGPQGSYRTDGTWGSFKSDPNAAHIPLDGSPY